MGKPIHKLSDVDLDAKTAVCAKCGPTKIKVSGRIRRCVGAVKAEKKKPEYLKYMANYMRGKGRGAHGLTIDEARALRASQSCWICGENDPDKLAVDHCHGTGVIRGILCRAHNTALGMFKDNPEHLMKAIEYLQGAPWI